MNLVPVVANSNVAVQMTLTVFDVLAAIGEEIYQCCSERTNKIVGVMFAMYLVHSVFDRTFWLVYTDNGCDESWNNSNRTAS